jgi:phosphatidylserine/phosphatidylglycerophosphate/cardiolipin synthase-like enzyme
MYLDVKRPPGDTSAAAELVRRFRHDFTTNQWPPDRPVPEVFYYPRSVEPTRGPKASLHAKCVVVDGRDVFVSSANFTEAAQERNIEVGLLVRSLPLAGRLVHHFQFLVADGQLRSVF